MVKMYKACANKIAAQTPVTDTAQLQSAFWKILKNHSPEFEAENRATWKAKVILSSSLRNSGSFRSGSRGHLGGIVQLVDSG